MSRTRNLEPDFKHLDTLAELFPGRAPAGSDVGFSSSSVMFETLFCKKSDSWSAVIMKALQLLLQSISCLYGSENVEPEVL